MQFTAWISGGFLMSTADTHSRFQSENGMEKLPEHQIARCRARRMLSHHRIQTLIRKEITSCLTFLAGFLASR
jgi:hypothetical protein